MTGEFMTTPCIGSPLPSSRTGW